MGVNSLPMEPYVPSGAKNFQRLLPSWLHGKCFPHPWQELIPATGLGADVVQVTWGSR